MNEQMYTLGPVMKAARKFKKLNQADVAQAIGCSQSALSKMEHNLLIPSAPQWFLFSRFTAIPPESLETGIIDRHSPIKFNSTEVSLGFKIPKKYRQFRAEKVRECYPFFQAMERENPELVKEFIASTGIDSEFFLDFDNLINFQLLADLMSFYLKATKPDSSDIKKLVKIGQNDLYWDHFKVEWSKLPDVELILNAFAREQIFFQSDFQLKVEESQNKIILSYYPEFHLRQLSAPLTEDLVYFLNLYRKYTLENLFQKLGKTVEAHLLQESTGTGLGARFLLRAA
jgi:transcriptional regulator with XRE-family HTH domain